MKALQIVKYGDLKSSLAFSEIEKPSVKPNNILNISHSSLKTIRKLKL